MNEKQVSIIVRNNQFLPKNLTDTFRKTAYQMGKILYTWLKADMKMPKSGRLYPQYIGISGKKYKKPRLFRASSENETPAIRTGEFRKSINFVVRGNRELEFGSGKDGFASKYAKALEFGTKNMKARQPIQRAVNANESKMKAILNSNIRNVILNQGFRKLK